MAARLKPHHQEDVKRKIQVVKLIELLQQDALGERIELSQGRRDSAKFLINKSVANPPTEISGAGENGEHIFELIAPWMTRAVSQRNG